MSTEQTDSRESTSSPEQVVQRAAAPALKPNQTVRIRAGVLEGLVGTVDRLGADGHALVHVAGVVEDRPVEFREWFAPEALELVR